MNAKLVCQAVEASAGLHPHIQIVLIRLAAKAGKNGECNARQTEISKESGLSSDSVMRAMKAIDDLGWTSRTIRHRRDGRRAADRVKITIDQPAVSGVVSGSQGRGERVGPTRCERVPVDIFKNTTATETLKTTQEGVSSAAANIIPALRLVVGGIS